MRNPRVAPDGAAKARRAKVGVKWGEIPLPMARAIVPASGRPAPARRPGFRPRAPAPFLAEAPRRKTRLRQRHAARARSSSRTPPASPCSADTEAATPQPLARFGVQPLYQVPGGIQRGLVIHQAGPERGQRHQMRPVAVIGAAHLDVFLHPRLGKTVVRWSAQSDSVGFSPGSAGSSPFRRRGTTGAQRVDVAAVAVDEVHRHIQHPVHIALEAEARVEDEGQHARPGWRPGRARCGCARTCGRSRHPSKNGLEAKSAVATGCSASATRIFCTMSLPRRSPGSPARSRCGTSSACHGCRRGPCIPSSAGSGPSASPACRHAAIPAARRFP